MLNINHLKESRLFYFLGAKFNRLNYIFILEHVSKEQTLNNSNVNKIIAKQRNSLQIANIL